MANILITGGSGFLGTHLIQYLNNKYQITNMSLSESKYIKTNFIEHNLRNPIIIDKQFDYIIHLAAIADVPYSINNPIQTLQVNTMGTANLLEYARTQDKLKCLINFVTDEVYSGTKDNQWTATTPYAASKCGQARVGQAYKICYKLPIINVYCCNIFGEYQEHKSGFIPLVVKKLINDESINLHCDADHNVGTREYIYAQNVVSAVTFILEHGKATEYNLSTHNKLTNLEIAKKIANIMNKDLEYKLIVPTDRGQYDLQYKFSSKKIYKAGWEPEVNFEDALEQTVSYYEAYYE